MTVKELIKELKKADPERLVLMSSDAEGNSYHKLSGYCQDMAGTRGGWEYEFGLEKLTPELEAEGYYENDVLINGEKALILFPEQRRKYERNK